MFLRYQKQIFFLVTSLFFLANSTKAIAAIKQFEIFIDINPPYSSSISTKSGIFNEIIAEAFTSADIAHRFLLKGEKLTTNSQLSKHRYQLFYYIRTPERNNKFHWITPLFRDQTVVINLKSSKEIKSINALKGIERIGTVAERGGESFLKSFSLEGQIYYCQDDESCLQRLRKNEIQAWITQKTKAIYYIKKLNLIEELNQYYEVYDGEIWLASSLNVPLGERTLLRNVLQSFMTTVKYTEILKKYEAEKLLVDNVP